MIDLLPLHLYKNREIHHFIEVTTIGVKNNSMLTDIDTVPKFNYSNEY